MRCTNISLSLALSLSSACAASTCESGFHIIVARAALELPGEGSTGAVADAIAAKVPKSDSTGLNYPGLPAPLYAFSVSQGVTNLHSDIASYVKSCPDAKIVLLGYDQGALVVGDVLGGVDVNATDPISRASADAVKGVVLFSDPSFVPGQPYDAGNATTSGIYPRSAASLKNLLSFGNRIKSYCDAGDTVCASGDNAAINRGYLDKYETAATNFIVGLYRP